MLKLYFTLLLTVGCLWAEDSGSESTAAASANGQEPARRLAASPGHAAPVTAPAADVTPGATAPEPEVVRSAENHPSHTPPASASAPSPDATAPEAEQEDAVVEKKTETQTEPDLQNMLHLQREFTDVLDDLHTALQSVNDRESANTASAPVGQACSKLRQLIRTGKRYGPPDKEMAKLLAQDATRTGISPETLAEKVLTDILTVYFHNCYGSEALLRAVEPFMEDMLEGADTLNTNGEHIPDVPDVAQP